MFRKMRSKAGVIAIVRVTMPVRTSVATTRNEYDYCHGGRSEGKTSHRAECEATGGVEGARLRHSDHSYDGRGYLALGGTKMHY